MFEIRGLPNQSHLRSVELPARYVDQTFSWVDAIVLLCADDDRRVETLRTVDSTLDPSPATAELEQSEGEGVQRPEYQTVSPIHLQTRLKVRYALSWACSSFAFGAQIPLKMTGIS